MLIGFTFMFNLSQKYLTRIVPKFLILLLATGFLWSLTPTLAMAESETYVQPNLSRFSESELSLQREDSITSAFADRITEFRLANGMKFIILENHEAPVVSFVTYADVGGVDEPDGKTGVAHFLEHLAFKGTKSIGTKDYDAEKQFLERLDQLFAQIKAAKALGNEAQVAKLTKEFNRVESIANSFVKQNHYGVIVDTAGGVGLNAATSADYTSYFYSFPANKLELWMSLESERFLEPVFREFYQEKQVILEERRLRTDNSPIGKTIEQFLDTAFTTHPYKRPTIGYNEDIRNLTRDDVQQFFDTYYTPNNLTIAIAGDVNPKQVKKLAKVYFGRFPQQPKPPKVIASEPTQTQTREVTVNLPTQPWYLEGYHIPALTHPDYPVYEVIADILSKGRTSRLYQSLVEKQQIALSAQGFSGFPGNKYPNLMLFYALTSPGHSIEEVATALREQIELLKTQPVTAAELNRVKTQLKANLINTLDSNPGMARLLAEYEAKTGSWRNIFRDLDVIAKINSKDIQRVAQATFTTENRTIGKLLSASNN